MLTLLLCAAAPFASAGNDTAAPPSPQAGLMWNRTGLPAVFPLQIKTPPGQDYFLTLIDVDTDDAALAAYITGGAFFKVLVPPGVFRLEFAFGDVWQGEDDLFGPNENTHHFELPEPLRFETRGIGVKAGHVVSLSKVGPGQIAQVSLKDQLICQFIRLEFPSSIYSTMEMEQARSLRYQGRSSAPIGPAEGFDEGVFGRLRYPGDFYRYSTKLRYDVRSRYCG